MAGHSSTQHGIDVAPDTPLLTPLKTPAPRKVRQTINASDEDGVPNLDYLATAWPLRLLQVVALWQPSSVPRPLSWLYYLLLLALQIWSAIWLVVFYARQAGVALGVLSAMHQLAAILLWLVVPWVVARKSEMLLNTLEYVAKKPQSPLNKLLLAYFVLFLLTLAAQIAYYALETIPFLSSFLLPSLPWHSSSSPAWLINLDLTILGMGFFFSLLMIQVTLLLIALSAHLQAFQLVDFHASLLSSPNVQQLKLLLHLTVQSLRKGNEALEPINLLLTLGFLVTLVQSLTRIFLDTVWAPVDLAVLLLVLLQLLFLLLPAAYVSRCWDRAHARCLALHAIALQQAEELGAVLVYMRDAYKGYTIGGRKIDGSFLVGSLFLLVALLAIKVQRDQLLPQVAIRDL